MRAVRMLAVTMLAVGVLAPGAGRAQEAGSGDPADVLVTFVRSGGFAGMEDRLEIRRDGGARVEGRGQEPRDFQVPADELATLEAELEAADFPHLEPSYRNDPPIADGYVYEVTYDGWTVRCEQDAGPPALEQVIDHLEEILRDASD